MLSTHNQMARRDATPYLQHNPKVGRTVPVRRKENL